MVSKKPFKKLNSHLNFKEKIIFFLFQISCFISVYLYYTRDITYVSSQLARDFHWKFNPSTFFLSLGGVREQSLGNLTLSKKVLFCSNNRNLVPMRQKVFTTTTRNSEQKKIKSTTRFTQKIILYEKKNYKRNTKFSQ